MCENEKVPSFGSDFGVAEAEAEISKMQEAAAAVTVVANDEVRIDLESDPYINGRGPAERSVDPEKKVEQLMDKDSLADIAANATSPDIESDSKYRERGIMEGPSWLEIHSWASRKLTLGNYWDENGVVSEQPNGVERPTDADVRRGIAWAQKKLFEYCDMGIEGVDYDKSGMARESVANKNRPKDFGWAIGMLKAGNKVARKEWHDKGDFLWFKQPTVIKAEWCKDPQLRDVVDKTGGEIPALGTICKYTVLRDTPQVLTGWIPTVRDMMANDWELVELGKGDDNG